MKSIGTLVVALLAAGAAMAQDKEALYLKGLAASCAQCHGTQGRAHEGAALPSLAGQPKVALLSSLQAFKAGTRPATVMHQLAKGYSDAQIEALATYFAAQKK